MHRFFPALLATGLWLAASLTATAAPSPSGAHPSEPACSAVPHPLLDRYGLRPFNERLGRLRRATPALRSGAIHLALVLTRLSSRIP